MSQLEVVIVEAVRSPLGKRGGELAAMHSMKVSRPKP